MKIYLLSVIISYLVACISVKAMIEEVKREGYVFENKYELSLWEKMQTLIKFCIPVLNITVVLILLFSDEVKKSAKQNIRSRGTKTTLDKA